MNEKRTHAKKSPTVPLEIHQKGFCTKCSDREYCRTDRLNRLECILCALLFNLGDRRV